MAETSRARVTITLGRGGQVPDLLYFYLAIWFALFTLKFFPLLIEDYFCMFHNLNVYLGAMNEIGEKTKVNLNLNLVLCSTSLVATLNKPSQSSSCCFIKTNYFLMPCVFFLLPLLHLH